MMGLKQKEAGLQHESEEALQQWKTRDLLEAILQPENLVQLQVLDQTALNSIVRLKELLGAIQAVKSAPEYLKSRDVEWLTLQQKREIRQLFAWLDRNGESRPDN